MFSKEDKAHLILFLLAAIWGLSFAVQKQFANEIGPFFFNAFRFLFGAICLFPLAFSSTKPQKENFNLRQAVFGGIACGLCTFGSNSMQQIGLTMSEAGKVSFISGFYIVLVPVLGIFWGRKVGRNVIFAILLAMTGLFLLCVSKEFSVQRGDILVFAGTFCSAGQILAIDYFVKKSDSHFLEFMMALACSAFSFAFGAIFEPFSLGMLKNSFLALLFTGIVVTGLGNVMQFAGQKNADPARASLLMSLESVFGAIFGAIFLHERLSLRNILGCTMMFAAIILVQIRPHRKS